MELQLDVLLEALARVTVHRGLQSSAREVAGNVKSFSSASLKELMDNESLGSVWGSREISA